MLEQDAFAAAAAADDGGRLPGLDIQVHSLQHLFIGEGFVKVPDLDHRRLKGRILLQEEIRDQE